MSGAFLDAVEERLKPLNRDSALAWWDAALDATEENAGRCAATGLALSNFLADTELFSTVEGALGSEDDPLDRRRLDLLRALMLQHQVPRALRERIVELEADVSARFSRHRGVVRGVEVDDNEIKRILRESNDPGERMEAWEASKTVGAEVADDVRELARLRNEAARLLGHRDWFALSLATDEVDEQKLLETLGDANRATAEPFARWKAALDERLAARFNCAVTDLRPWHYADPFFQETPSEGGVNLDPLFDGQDVVELSKRTFDSISLDPAGILGRSDLYPREGKNQHAFCMDVDREGDVRILVNVIPNHDWATTTLHELGHGVYALGYDKELPWLLRDTHLVTTEASAILFGGLASTPEWLERVLGVSPGECSRLEAPLRRARAAELLVFTRWVLVMNAFERALYADPDGDLDSTWWQLVSRFQLVTPPDGRGAPDWAAKIHIATSPVYYHTYLYGTIVALQLKRSLEAAVGGIVDRPEAGALVARALFSPGHSIRWDQLVERACGAPFSVDALARAVVHV